MTFIIKKKLFKNIIEITKNQPKIFPKPLIFFMYSIDIALSRATWRWYFYKTPLMYVSIR